MAKYFNANLKYIRQLKGISQQQLADKIGTDRSTISRWENGEIDTPLEMAMKIAEELKVPYYDFFGKDLTIDNENIFNITPKEKEDNFITQYQLLFDKDDRLTPEEKKFIVNYLEAKHKEIDKEMDKKE